jgi:regulator of sigma E protease
VFVTILACIFVFGVLISIHEFGHFITAKLTDMRVDEFAIGFGPEIWQKQKGETLYSLRLLPLGGYNRIAGMDPDDPPDLDRGFNSKSVWARMFVILAGSLMNLLLPVFIFFVLFIVSGVNLPVNEPVIGEVVPGYAAAATGMQKGDRILTINGRAVEDWTGVREQIAAAGTQPTQIVIERNGARQTLTMTPAVNPDTGRPFIGVVSSVKRVHLGPGQAAITSVRATGNILKSMYMALYQMVTGKTGAELAGPVGVAKMTGEMAHQGFSTLLQFMALLSLNLAVINLLPLPALDGGHFFILLGEAITGRKLGKKAMLNIQKAGVIMILTVTILATYMDFTR